MKGVSTRTILRSNLLISLMSVMLAVIATGCAFSNVSITLPTQPTSGYSGGNNRVVSVPKFIDQREIKDRIGMQKNGFAMDTANAIPDQSVDAWLAGRLTVELKAAGFQVDDDGANPKAVKIQGYVLKMFTEPVVQWTSVDLETDLAVRMQVIRGDGLEAERRYFVKAVEQGMMSLSGAFNSSVNKASDALMKRLVPDVINLLNMYPER